MRTITLQELGNNLPIPSEAGRQAFNFKVWRLPEEKKISELRNKHKNLGKFVRETFEFMLTDLGGKKVDAMNDNERKLMLNQMPFANIFYMWMYLRYEALGEKLKMAPIDCPHCAGEVKDIVADLNSLEIKCAGFKETEDGGWAEEEKAARTADYKLKKPMQIGDVTVHSIRFGFTPWDAMERLPVNERNFGTIKEAMMAASIQGGLAEESKDMLPLQKDLVLKSLSKRDIEGYYDALDSHNGGPVLAMTIPCPHCGKEFMQPLNWTYEYFFGNSSL